MFYYINHKTKHFYLYITIEKNCIYLGYDPPKSKGFEHMTHSYLHCENPLYKEDFLISFISTEKTLFSTPMIF